MSTIALELDEELTEDEEQAVLGAAWAEYSILMVEREAKPHRVHFKAVHETEDTSWYDDPPQLDADGAPILHERHVKVQRASVSQCPDCTRGLHSRPDGLICSRLPNRTPLKACHAQCVVACGMPR